MNKKALFLIVVGVVVGCGGGKGSQNNPQPETRIGNYTDFVRESLSLTVGEKAELGETSFNNGGSGAAPSVANTTFSNDAFSTTNVQIAGVDEADVIKFDGDFLLYLNRTNNWAYALDQYVSTTQVSVYAESALEGMEPADSQFHFNPDENANVYYLGMQRHGDYAALIGSKSFVYYFVPTLGIWHDPGCPLCYTPQPTVNLKFWQYQDEGEPALPQDTTVVIDGNIVESRAIGNKLYIVSSFSPSFRTINYSPLNNNDLRANQQIIDALTLVDVAPSITVNGQKRPLITDNDCVLPPVDKEAYIFPTLMLVTEFSFDDPNAWKSTCSIGYTTNIFVSQENLYTFGSNGDGDIQIDKYALTANGPVYRARGTVEGAFTYDSYRFGEVEGKLVVVTTDFNSQNNLMREHSLSVLEENNGRLQVVAQIPNQQRPETIGKPNEDIYAVRIFGERAYVVTFQRIDPLYTIDLSDPYDPRVLGELEIPGYSAYLHPVSEDLLLGIGKNVEGAELGLNVRLFDVSDPTNPLILQSLDYGLRGSESEALYDPHAFTYLYDEDSQIARFTLPMRLHGDAANPDPTKGPTAWYDFSERGLYQFELDTVSATLEERNRYLLDDSNNGNNYYSYGERAVINGNSIYYAHGDIIDVIPWGENSAVRSFNVTED